MINTYKRIIGLARDKIIRHHHLIIISIAIFLMHSLAVESSGAETKEILVLHSYHQGLVWTDDIMEGIYSVFNKYDPDVDIHVEYMDTKRYFDDHRGEYLTELHDIYKIKYGSMKLDMIISSDDNAFQFLLLHHKDLFPGTPIVFCGVNNFEDNMLAGHESVTGVIEFLDQKASIDIALKLHPDTEKMAVITETSSSGSVNRTIIEALADEYKDRVQFIFLDKENTGLTLQELLDKLRQLPEKSIVYYSDFLRSRGEYIIQETAVPQISRASKYPIYTHYDEILGLGIVGGKLVSGKSHGRKAAEMAAEILRGTPIGSLPVHKQSINAYLFDYKQLERFGIDENALPEGSEVINRPSSLYNEHKQLVWTVLGIFSFLVISLITISINVVKRKKAEEKLKIAHDDLEQKVEARTHSLNEANLNLHAEIEDRIRAEKALEKAKRTAEEEKLKMDAIIASIGDGISIQDTGFRVLYQNQRHIDMVGYHVGEFCYSGYQKKERICENCHLALSFIDGNIHRKEQSRTTDQGTSYYEIISSPIKDSSGNVIAGVEAVRDITDQKNSEINLRESENRFRAAFENAAVGASMVDLRGRFIKVNRRLCEMLGYSEMELLSKTFSDLTYPEDIHIGMNAMKELIAGNAGYHSFEKRYIHKEGHLIYFIISPSLIRDTEGRPLHFLGLFQDISSRKKMEVQIIASLEEKEVMLREIHHRVKNNMTVISSMLALHSRLIRNDQDRLLMDEARARIKAMAIIHEKLYQSGDMSKINAQDYLGDILKEISSSYAVNNGRIVVRTDIQDIALSIDDAIPFGLILHELVSNAIKHAFPELRQGEIKVNIGLSGTSDVRLMVSDNGVGVPADIESRKSTSLGLNLVDALVRQLRGEMKLHNGNGTRFDMTFPRRQS